MAHLTRARFVYNPRSGHNARDPRVLASVQAFVRDTAPGAAVVHTQHPGHATELAAEAVREGCELVVAVGGDGTLNEVARALVGTQATLGIVPSGSGNGLARHLRIPLAPRAALEDLRNGRPRLIDSGLADGHPFFNAMGLGFDAEIARLFAHLPRRGLAAYVRTVASALRTYRSVDYRVSGPGIDRFSARAFLLTIANSDQYGNNCFVAPGARIDDGRLDLTLVRNVTPVNLLPLLVRFFSGRLTNSANVSRLRATRFVIERAMAGTLHVDGEPRDCGQQVAVEVRPSSLRVLVPSAG